VTNKKRNKANKEKEDLFLDRLAALSPVSDECDQSVLEAELRECGIDPAELRKDLHGRLLRLANHNYITLDKECPPKLRDFLHQMRPPTVEEEAQREKSRATSKISDLLSSIRSGIVSALTPPALQAQNPAQAFRNKRTELTEKDRDLLKSHQSEIDAESEDEKP
jgi:hypothetical protein